MVLCIVHLANRGVIAGLSITETPKKNAKGKRVAKA